MNENLFSDDEEMKKVDELAEQRKREMQTALLSAIRPREFARCVKISSGKNANVRF